MIQIKSAFEASFGKLLASLKARLDARVSRIVANLKATLDANSAKLLDDIKVKLAAIDANNSALLDRIKSRLDGRATQPPSISNSAAGSDPTDVDELNERVRPGCIRRFFRYVLRVLVTGRLRPPVLGHR